MSEDLRHGRAYMYFAGEPLHPFGYGLSYTTFRRLRPEDERVAHGTRRRGHGERETKRHEGSKVERPRKELLAFERVGLEAGETKTVQLMMVGGSSSDVRLETTVTVAR